MKTSERTVGLRKIRDFLKANKRWAKGAWGFKDGLPVGSAHPDADKRCLLDTIKWVDGPLEHEIEVCIYRAIYDVTSKKHATLSTQTGITSFNDREETTHADIVAVCKRAVEISVEADKKGTLWDD